MVSAAEQPDATAHGPLGLDASQHDCGIPVSADGGPDFGRTVVDRPGSPIHRQGRRFYAFEDELMAWMRGEHS